MSLAVLRFVVFILIADKATRIAGSSERKDTEGDEKVDISAMKSPLLDCGAFNTISLVEVAELITDFNSDTIDGEPFIITKLSDVHMPTIPALTNGDKPIRFILIDGSKSADILVVPRLPDASARMTSPLPTVTLRLRLSDAYGDRLVRSEGE